MTSADVSAGHVPAGASIRTRVGFALVVIDVAVSAAPASVTLTLIADREKMLKSQVQKSSFYYIIILTLKSFAATGLVCAVAKRSKLKHTIN